METSTKTEKPEIDYIYIAQNTGHYNWADFSKKDTCFIFHLPNDMKFKDKMRVTFMLAEEYSQYVTASRNDPLTVAEQILSEMEEHYLFNSDIDKLKLFVNFLDKNYDKNRKRFLNYSIKLAKYNIEKWEEQLSSIK